MPAKKRLVETTTDLLVFGGSGLPDDPSRSTWAVVDGKHINTVRAGDSFPYSSVERPEMYINAKQAKRVPAGSGGD